MAGKQARNLKRKELGPIMLTIIVTVLVTSIYSQKIGDAFWSGDVVKLLSAGLGMVIMTIILFEVMIRTSDFMDKSKKK